MQNPYLRLRRLARALYALPPKEVVERAIAKFRPPTRTLSVAAIVNTPKYLQPQRMTNFLWRYEQIVRQRMPDWRLRLEGRDVLEVGGGPLYGFGLASVFFGCRRYVCVEPEFNTDAIAHPNVQRFFDITYRDLIALHGARVTAEVFQAAIRRIEIFAGFLEEYDAIGTADLSISNSTLEHIADLDRALACLHRATRPGGEVLHVVDFGNHSGTPNPFDDIYSVRPETYRAAHGTMLNLLRRSDILECFRANGFTVTCIPYYSWAALPAAVHPWWRERYADDDLLLKVGVFIGKKS